MSEVVKRPSIWEGVAKEAYKAYAAVTDNKNFRGEPMPEFDELPEKIRMAWEAAVEKAVEVCK